MIIISICCLMVSEFIMLSQYKMEHLFSLQLRNMKT